MVLYNMNQYSTHTRFSGFSWKTNDICFTQENERDVVIKKFSVVKSAILNSLYNLGAWLSFYPEFHFYTVTKRIGNEIEGRKLLQNLDISVPEILWHDDRKRTICMEMVGGKNFLEYCKSVDSNLIHDFSRKIGGTVENVHNAGYALVDCRSENFIISEDKLYALDLEFFSENGTKFQKKCDFATFYGSILSLNPEIYKTVIMGFNEGYPHELTKRDMMMIAGFSSLYPISLKENLDETKNRAFNLFNLLKNII